METICRNGPSCHFLKKGFCRYFHPPSLNQPIKGIFFCPSRHNSTKYQLTGKPCQRCRRSVQGYGLQCTVCSYYVCKNCEPVRHKQVCTGLHLFREQKMKTCRRCNRLITDFIYSCPLRCNYFICTTCVESEYDPLPVKKKYVEKKVVEEVKQEKNNDW